MKELQQTLIDLGFKVRLDKDGNEVEEPSDYSLMSISESQKHSELMDNYEQAAEAILLPDSIEMWSKIRTVKDTANGIIGSADEYFNFIQTELKKEMFVNELKKPKGEKCCGGIQSGYPCDCHGELVYNTEDIYHFQQAEEKVLFHGFKRAAKSERDLFASSPNDGMLYFSGSGNIYYSEIEFDSKNLETIHDLQSQVQLYLKIK